MSTVRRIKFIHPTFHAGRNLTMRRGVELDGLEWAHIVELGRVFKVHTRVMCFKDLTDKDLENEHDPACRTAHGMLAKMREIWPDFDTREIITLVYFDVPADALQEMAE